MLKIGEISYANVYPIFHELKKYNNYRFISSVPSVLNMALREGGIDVSPCSSIEYAKSPENYLIIPGVSISSQKEVKSVCLFSKCSIEYLKGKKIFLTADSGTSVVLLKIILKKFFNMNVFYTNDEKDCDGNLYIGDKALFKYYSREYKYVYDLGKLWHEFTHLPFVFALWLVNTNCCKNSAEDLDDFVDLLLKIKSESKKNLSALIDFYCFKGLSSYQIIDYWEIIDYRLDESHIKGLEKYYELAHQIGELKNIPKLNFYSKI